MNYSKTFYTFIVLGLVTVTALILILLPKSKNASEADLKPLQTTEAKSVRLGLSLNYKGAATNTTTRPSVNQNDQVQKLTQSTSQILLQLAREEASRSSLVTETETAVGKEFVFEILKDPNFNQKLEKIYDRYSQENSINKSALMLNVDPILQRFKIRDGYSAKLWVQVPNDRTKGVSYFVGHSPEGDYGKDNVWLNFITAYGTVSKEFPGWDYSAIIDLDL